MQITEPVFVLILVWLVINLGAFVAMMLDKSRSRQMHLRHEVAGQPGLERLSEGLLFFMAAAFGAVGVYAGMFAFRHKTRKWYFIIGMPLLIVENVATLYCCSLIFT